MNAGARRDPNAQAMPIYAKRRTFSLVPSNTYGNFDLTAPQLWRDPLLDCPVLPKPTRRRFLFPSLNKFMKGRSSLYSVARAVSNLHQEKRGLTRRLGQALLWARLDQKELVAQQNQLYADSPALPPALSVKLKMSRASIAKLLDDRFVGFRYRDIKDVYMFFRVEKSADESSDEEEDKDDEGGVAVGARRQLQQQQQQQPKQKRRRKKPRIRRVSLTVPELQSLVDKCSLRSGTVVLWVGSYAMSGLPMMKGLGTVYLSTGKVISGEAALAMRVKQKYGI